MYQCEICSFSTKDKSKFSRHCNRKFTCVPQNDLLENQSDDGCSKNGRNRRNFKSFSGIYGRCSAEKSPQKGLLGISSENDELKKKFDEVIVTNTVPISDYKKNGKLKIIDVSWLAAQSIINQIKGESLQKLFNDHHLYKVKIL